MRFVVTDGGGKNLGLSEGITPDVGYGGHDEDQGQMGGVSALMSIGLLSLRGTTAVKPFHYAHRPSFAWRQSWISSMKVAYRRIEAADRGLRFDARPETHL